MKKTKEQNRNKGITLIALVITIIVMLILVAVTISMAVNGGLFNYAGKAVSETNNALKAEQDLANGRITIGGVYYNSIDEYLKEISTGETNIYCSNCAGKGYFEFSYCYTCDEEVVCLSIETIIFYYCEGCESEFDETYEGVKGGDCPNCDDDLIDVLEGEWYRLECGHDIMDEGSWTVDCSWCSGSGYKNPIDCTDCNTYGGYYETVCPTCNAIYILKDKEDVEIYYCNVCDVFCDTVEDTNDHIENCR